VSFEVKEKDLLGRIGKLKTKSGILETPLLFPVINPTIQLVPPQRLKDEFGFEAVITNSYILRKRYGDEPAREGLLIKSSFMGTSALRLLRLSITKSELTRISPQFWTFQLAGVCQKKKRGRQSWKRYAVREPSLKSRNVRTSYGLGRFKVGVTWTLFRNQPKRWGNCRFRFML